MTSSRSLGDESLPVSGEWLARHAAPSLELLVCRPAIPTTGAPVLFLHGAFAGAWCWQENWLPRLAATGRFAAAVSLRGHGGSEGRDSLRWAGLTAFQNDLTDAIVAMPAPPVVVAHSLGGLIAQQILGLALAGSIHLRGLVLVGSLPPEGLTLIATGLGVKTWLGILSGRADSRRASGFTDRRLRTGDGTWNATVAAAHAASGGDVAFTALAQAMIPAPILPARLAGIPVLVLHGAEDPMIDRATAARTAAYHGADVVMIPEAGHYPMLGRHAGAGADALRRWLETKGL